jgi:hypothetical protein
VREKLMVMPTQASDCNKAQCPPTTHTSDSTRAILLSRFNTKGDHAASPERRQCQEIRLRAKRLVIP